MRVFIFLGPTLSRRDASKELNATYLPPVAQGDVFRAAREDPFAIGIIDGYFDRLPAVWHKEILWALKQGIHVFGAASMGALRAAELAAFGMKGIGAIFDAFQSGALEDDDEVAVAHGDGSTGYRATSEAMVNIRATLRGAEGAGILSVSTGRQLEAIAKALFYPDRSYPQLLALGVERGLPDKEIGAFRTFIADRRVDQKRADATRLLAAIKDCVDAGAAPRPVKYTFHHTEAWDQVVEWAETRPPLLAESELMPAELLTAEVRLSGSAGRSLLATAFVRAAAAALARRTGVPDHQARVAALDRHMRLARGGHEAGDSAQGFQSWLEGQGLTSHEYSAFLDRKVELDWMRERCRLELEKHVIDELRLNGTYSELASQARDKQRLLANRGLAEPSLEDVGMDGEELLAWYFENRLCQPVPKDLNAFLTEVGLADIAALQREAIRELLYTRLSATDR